MHRCLVAATICLLVSERAAVAQSPAPIVANLSLDELSGLRVKGSDHGVLAMDASKMTVGKGPRVFQIIHSRNDTMAEVRVDQMVRGIALVEQLIRRVDASE
jgi:hypothetical protein